jgi:hypothetical protein
MNALRRNARIVASVEVVLSDERAVDVIPRTSGGVADIVILGMSAASGIDAQRNLEAIRPMLDRLPTTLLVWSNGQADVFA